MKRSIVRASAVLIVFAMMLSFAACGQQELLVRFVDGSGNDLDLGAILGSAAANQGSAANVPADTGTNTGTNTAPPAATAAPDTPAATAAPSGDTAPAATAAPSNDTTPAATAAPSGDDTPAAPATEAPATEAPAAPSADYGAILSTYKSVVDQFKVDSPEWYKIEYQEITNANLGAVLNRVLDLAAGYMTTEEDARADPTHHLPGESMHGNTPIPHNDSGCLLTDPTPIKYATQTDNGDGTTTITICLNDELNPEPPADDSPTSPSYIGAMFAPMAKSTIDEELAKIPGLSVNSFSLNYTDCETTITFNNSDHHMVSWKYIMNVDITADAKLLVFPIQGSARLIDRMEYWDIKY
ncbi:MAG: hypothetical protein K6C36_07320 [Clostridia bacterium]|nr:hypothetical protein [Clostridia bacterium]